MSQALSTRDAVGQAKGMLMQSDDLTGQQAFDLRARASQHTNIKLSEVAQWLIDEHEGRDRAERPRASWPRVGSGAVASFRRVEKHMQ